MSKLGVVEDTLFVPMLGRIYASEYCPQTSSPVSHLSMRPVSLLRLRAATFSESAPNAATIISKVFFSIDTISIFMQLSVCPQR